MDKPKIKVLFTDLGGVLLTNGWDHKSRAAAVSLFGLDEKEFESRHQLLFGDYETGKISLETYLRYAVFYQPRPFTYDLFIEFMYSQSKVFPEMIELMKTLKKKYHIKIVVISNEGRELTNFRVNTFKLTDFVDLFIVSCFIGTRKPDRKVWELALDLVQAPPQETAYLEDRQLFVEIAKEMGIQAFRHQNCAASTVYLDELLSRV